MANRASPPADQQHDAVGMPGSAPAAVAVPAASAPAAGGAAGTYTAAEDEIIEDALRANKPRKDIVELLPGRSLSSVKNRIQKLRKPKKPKKPKNLTVVTDSGVTLALRNPCIRSPNFSMQGT